MGAEQYLKNQASSSMPISIRSSYLLPLQRPFGPLVLGITFSVLAWIKLVPGKEVFVEMGEVRVWNDCPPYVPTAKAGVLTDGCGDKGIVGVLWHWAAHEGSSAWLTDPFWGSHFCPACKMGIVMLHPPLPKALRGLFPPTDATQDLNSTVISSVLSW